MDDATRRHASQLDDAEAARATRHLGALEASSALSSAGAASERHAGTLIGGRYRLERPLNAGGMGTVHLAQPIGGNQKVVVKFPHAHLLSSPDFLARFAQETQAMQKLTHPHVVEIYDAGVERETPYLVVRYMGGGSLKDWIQSAGGRLLPTQLEWLRPIADALDFIHSQNVVHRDVKPENLLFDVHGTVYLSDFGIAKIRGGGPELAREAIMGSPSYMAPEYMQDSYTELDQYRMDQYSLAVVVYEALCGALPHASDSVPVLLEKKLTETPYRPSARWPDLSEGLSDAVMRALAPDPADRFESCGEFADAVLALPAPGRRRRWPVACAAALALVAASASAYAYRDRVPRIFATPLPPLVVRESLTEIEAQQLDAREKLGELRLDVDEIHRLFVEFDAEAQRLPVLEPFEPGAVPSDLPELEQRVREFELVLKSVDGRLRMLALLGAGMNAVQARSPALLETFEALEGLSRAHEERLAELGDELAAKSLVGARDPGLVELERGVELALRRGAADEVRRADIAQDANRAAESLHALEARIASEQRASEDQRRQIERAQLSLQDRRRQLADSPPDTRPDSPPAHLRESLAEIETQQLDARTKLGGFQHEVDWINRVFAELDAEARHLPPLARVPTGPAPSAAPAREQRLRELGLARDSVDGRLRTLATLRERLAPIETRAAALLAATGTIEAQSRAHVERVAQLRAELVALRAATSGAPDPRLGEIERGLDLTARRTAANGSRRSDIVEDASRAARGVRTLVTRLASEQRASEAQGTQIEQAQASLR